MKLQIFCLCFLAAIPLISSASGETVTGYDLIKRQQTAPFDAIVEHCRQNAPEAMQSVEAGYSNYQKNLNRAMATWISEKPGMQQRLEQKVPSDSAQYREVQQTLKDIGRQILENIKQYDPHKYCPWVASRLEASTPDSILKSLHEYDARVEAKLREQKHE